MVHRVTDLNTGGKGIDDEATRFLFKHRDQGTRGAKVLGVTVEARRELTLERTGAGEEFSGSFPDYNERERPKRFRRQFWMLQEIRGTRERDTRLAFGFLRDGGGLSGGERRNARKRGNFLAILLKRRTNPGGEHRRARRTLDADRECLEKRVCLRAALHEDKPRLGAKLPHSESKRTQ